MASPHLQTTVYLQYIIPLIRANILHTTIYLSRCRVQECRQKEQVESRFTQRYSFNSKDRQEDRISPSNIQHRPTKTD